MIKSIANPCQRSQEASDKTAEMLERELRRAPGRLAIAFIKDYNRCAARFCWTYNGRSLMAVVSYDDFGAMVLVCSKDGGRLRGDVSADRAKGRPSYGV